jgi:Mn-dependent DtxR family transcriptional regulator
MIVPKSKKVESKMTVDQQSVLISMNRSAWTAGQLAHTLGYLPGPMGRILMSLARRGYVKVLEKTGAYQRTGDGGKAAAALPRAE